MTSRLAHVALIGLLFATACSDSGGSSSDSSGNSSGSEATGSTEPGGTDGEAFVAVDVPAGVNWATSSLTPPATTTTLPSFAQVTATAGVPPAPQGFPFRQSDYISQVFTVGDVQLATGTCGCWQGGDSTGVFGGLRTPVYLFRSGDGGATWAQVNLAGVLGDVNGQINNIVEHDGAMILTATTSDAAGSTPTAIDVLRSTDGATWQRLSRVTADPPAPTSVHAFDLYSLGSALVLYGGDQACAFDGSSAIQNIGPAYQSRFWTSADGGATWTAQSPAETGLDSGQRPALPDAATCAGLGIQDILDQYGSNPRLVQLADDHLLVWSDDGQHIFSTTDGSTWSTATLDGTIALPSEAVAAPEANSQASAIFAIDGGFVAMNLEEYRLFDDGATGSTSGLSVVTWASDDGVTWQRQPLGRPIPSPDYSASYQFFVTDAGLGLWAFNRTDDTSFGTYESIAGVSENWAICAATAGANCSFASEVTAIEPGADLSGIDLSFSSIEGSDLTDVSFADARLVAVNTEGVTIERTNFNGAVMEYVSLYGDLTTSTFDGATLTNVRFDDHFFSMDLPGATITSPSIRIADTGLPAGVSLAGRDLTGYEFTGGSLAGADFTGANLTRSTFSYTDLTGATFTGAVLDGIFIFEVTCPDGQPPTDGAFGAATCRL